jgi:hypothetical protein
LLVIGPTGAVAEGIGITIGLDVLGARLDLSLVVARLVAAFPPGGSVIAEAPLIWGTGHDGLD